MYKCSNCKRSIKLKPEEPIRCPFCGHKILFKERPKVLKRVKAE